MLDIISDQDSGLVKTSVLAGSLATFIAAIGVALYETPIIVGLVTFLITAAAVLLLRKMKKLWYYYFAMLLFLLAKLIYLQPI